MHYNAEFRIIPYKLLACGIINEFAQGCFKVLTQPYHILTTPHTFVRIQSNKLVLELKET